MEALFLNYGDVAEDILDLEKENFVDCSNIGCSTLSNCCSTLTISC
ncbi:hypothetical protein [Carnobacterium maltaromaticum]|nr:hypothetical protein [Carnobacterium maltaromaticum]CAD5903048.1 hypothetical protein CMALT394_610002 [Carnobacterium maltaromaticum]